jgi:hypothetical protein
VEISRGVLQDTEDDQTCLEDFQECIEEYQECLEVVHICIDEDNSSFNRSASTSQIEDLGENITNAQKNFNSDFLDNNNLLTVKQKDSIGDSDLDISYKSTNDHLNNKLECDNKTSSGCAPLKTIIDNKALIKTDSLTQSDKASNQDGYETCVDESLSEEGPKNNNNEQGEEEVTPTNSKVNVSGSFGIDSEVVTVINATSEPCLALDQCTNHIYLDTKSDDELKSYDQSDSLGPDEFFLVQYPPDEAQEVPKSFSEPNVLDTVCEMPPRKLTYRLREYYNDYKDCLESYKVYSDEKKDEMSDDLIFNEIFLPFKSRSAPNIMDSSFVTLTYDPGPDRSRRKSDIAPGHQANDDSEGALSMTVIKPIDSEYGALKTSHVNDMLQKHWGSTHTIKVFREPNTSLGISIVGGKVDIHSTDSSFDKVLGIFVKNVVPDSPAGKLGLFKTGDRILEVSGVDLRHESHEKAVEAIRNAANPVTFVIQSLIPWNYENEVESFKSNENNCPSPYPSPVSDKPPTDFELPQITISNEDQKQEMVQIKVEEVSEEKGSREISTKVYMSVERVPSPPLINDKDVSLKDESLEESEEDEEVDIREMEGRTVTTKGQQIDRASAGNFKRSKEEISDDLEEEDDFGYTNSECFQILFNFFTSATTQTESPL